MRFFKKLLLALVLIGLPDFARSQSPLGIHPILGYNTATGTGVPGANTDSSDLFVAGENGYRWFREPCIVVSPTNGTIIVIVRVQSNQSDSLGSDFVAKRSLDNGVTWSSMFLVYHEASFTGVDGSVVIGAPCAWYNVDGSKLHVLIPRGTYTASSTSVAWTQTYHTSSTDDGCTWAATNDLSTSFDSKASNKTGTNGYVGTISSLANNGGGLIRVATAAAHGMTTGWKVVITGNSQANGTWTINGVDTTHFDLQTSTFSSNVTGGTFTAQTQYHLVLGHATPLAKSTTGHNGRIIIPGYHRYPIDDSGTAWLDISYSDDDGATWTYASVDETNSANDGAIEPSAVETNTAGKIYVTYRKNNVGRAHNYLTTDGTTLGTSVTDDGTNSTTNLSQNASSAGFCGVSRYNATNFVLPLCISVTDRNRGGIYLTTQNECLSWPNYILETYDPCAYADTIASADGTIVEVRERGLEIPYINNGVTWAGKISIFRMKPAAISSPVAPYFLYDFDDLNPAQAALISSSYNPPAVATHLQDKGFWSHPAYILSTDTTWPVWVAGRLSGGTALQLGTTHYVRLQESTTSAFEGDFSGDDGSFSFECQIKTTNNNGWIVAGNPASNGFWGVMVGVVSSVGTSHKATFSVRDNSNTRINITGTTSVDDGNWHRIVAVRDRSAGTGNKLRLYVDGASDATAVTDTTALTSGNSLTEHRLNMDGAGANALGLTIDWLRFTHGVITVSAPNLSLPANFASAPNVVATPADPASSPASISMSGTITAWANNGSGLARVTCSGHKLTTGALVTPAGTGNATYDGKTFEITWISSSQFDLKGTYTYVTPGSNGTYTAKPLVLWADATFAANSIYKDAFCHNPLPSPAPFGQQGWCVGSIKDRSYRGGEWLINRPTASDGNYARAAVVRTAYDGVVGPSILHDAGTTSVDPLNLSNMANSGPFNVDFIQNTGYFTVSMMVDVHGSAGGGAPGTGQLFGAGRTADHPNGFMMTYDNPNSTLGIWGPNGGGWAYAGTIPGNFVNVKDTWYHLVIRGNGFGSALVFNTTVLGAGSVGSNTNGNTLTGSAGSFACPNDFQLGTVPGDAGTPLSVYFKNVCIFAGSISDADVTTLYNFRQ